MVLENLGHLQIREKEKENGKKQENQTQLKDRVEEKGKSVINIPAENVKIVNNN